MSNKIILQGITSDELINQIYEKVINSLPTQQPTEPEELLTREEACELLKIDLSTLYRWTVRGKVTAYSISGTRRYYKRSELLEALTPLKK